MASAKKTYPIVPIAKSVTASVEGAKSEVQSIAVGQRILQGNVEPIALSHAFIAPSNKNAIENTDINKITSKFVHSILPISSESWLKLAMCMRRSDTILSALP